MKLKMIKPPHLGQKDMVCNTDFGTFAVDLGQVLEVSDAAGTAILGTWGPCFQVVSEGQKAAKAMAEVSSPEEEAEIEATKMAKGYSNKKV